MYAEMENICIYLLKGYESNTYTPIILKIYNLPYRFVSNYEHLLACDHVGVLLCDNILPSKPDGSISVSFLC